MRSLLTLILLVLTAAPSLAVETRLAVRVLAQDAKFVGTSMGGVRILVHDDATGELLASGVTAGGTGDTERIMRTPRERGATLSTEGSAVFETVLDLDAPTRLRITAQGPLAQPQALATVETTHWAVPGRHLDGGDGVLLPLTGFAVDVLAPAAHSRAAGLPQTLHIEANVVMMCGCPVAPGGLWDADAFEVTAQILRDGVFVEEIPLAFAGTTSRFAADYECHEPGAYEVVVFAYDASNGNTGLDRSTFLVMPGR